MSMYTASVPQVSKMIGNMLVWLDKAEALAKAKNFDVNTLLQARLAPDMYPLVRQMQSACDNAKFIAARLTDTKAPSDPDTETTVAELRARIEKTRAYLSTITEAQFQGAADRKIRPNYLPEGLAFQGNVYLNESALPNFYFHLSMAYAILRHNGVDVGKRDFIGSVPTVQL
jgi:uncharacterized protein